MRYQLRVVGLRRRLGPTQRPGTRNLTADVSFAALITCSKRLPWRRLARAAHWPGWQVFLQELLVTRSGPSAARIPAAHGMPRRRVLSYQFGRAARQLLLDVLQTLALSYHTHAHCSAAAASYQVRWQSVVFRYQVRWWPVDFRYQIRCWPRDPSYQIR